MRDPQRRSTAALKRQEEAERAMRGWKAWLLIGVIGCLGGFLLSLGLANVVRVERAGERVDVTLQRRFLGLVPLSTETVHDVVKSDVYIVWNRRSGTGGKQSRGATEALELTRRDGGIVRRTRFGPSFGTPPSEMAPQIAEFIARTPGSSSLTTWWMPWLVNVASLPFVLIFGAIVGEVVLSRLSRRRFPRANTSRHEHTNARRFDP